MSGQVGPAKYPPKFDPEIVKAIHWCRLGRVRPDDPSAFHRAKEMGLLAQDPVWRATPQGEGVLVALGLLEGKPTPKESRVHVLWAVSAGFPRPQLVAAFSDGLVECFHGHYMDRRRDAEDDWRAFGDEGGWTFFTTVADLAIPAQGPADTRADRPASRDVS